MSRVASPGRYGGGPAAILDVTPDSHADLDTLLAPPPRPPQGEAVTAWVLASLA
jgi:hypothetical protein